MTHGWPGSVVELIDTVGPLTDPTAHLLARPTDRPYTPLGANILNSANPVTISTSRQGRGLSADEGPCEPHGTALTSDMLERAPPGTPGPSGSPTSADWSNGYGATEPVAYV